MGWTIGTCSMSTCNCLGAAKMASVSEKNGNSVSGGKPERGGLTGSGTGLEPKPIRVSVIDDDPMICQAMSLILNDYSHGRIEVVSTSTDGETCVRRAAEEKPDVVLMDMRMPQYDGSYGITRIKADFPDIRVLVLTTFDDRETVDAAVQGGADGYILKEMEDDKVIQSVKAVCAGIRVFGGSVFEGMRRQMAPAGAGPGLDLTPRERDIMRLVAQGMDNREIAAGLFLAEGTVRNNISRLLEKLKLKDRTQLAVFTVKNNLDV